MKQTILSPTAMREKLMKGLALPEGTVKNWKGVDYIKKAGKWIPKPKGKGSDGPTDEDMNGGNDPMAGKGELKLSFQPPSDLRKMTPEQNREYVEHIKKNYKPSEIQTRITAIEAKMEKLRDPIESGEGTRRTVQLYVNLRHNRDLHEHALGEAKKAAAESEKAIDDYWDSQGSEDYKGAGLSFDKVAGGKKKEPEEKPKKAEKGKKEKAK